MKRTTLKKKQNEVQQSKNIERTIDGKFKFDFTEVIEDQHMWEQQQLVDPYEQYTS